jgi:hypothetical protein
MGLGVGVGISIGLGVGVAVSDPLGETGDIGTPGPRRRVVESAARMTVPNPFLVAGSAAGLRSADGLGLTSGAGLVSLIATGEEWLVALGRWRGAK